ncbi:MAG: hypothetical protein PVH73_05880 [Candidatus Bathyarchaeota archaeon]|jgi:hypothetical protein
MQRTSKIMITVMALVVAVSLIGNVWGNGYETVGGEVAPINFITTFLVPALVIIGIFGALIMLGVIRIKFKSDANESK